MENKDSYKVWISSFEHLDKFKKIASSIKWWKQLFNIQKIESSFPQVIIAGRPSPIIFHSTGELLITDLGIEFKSTDPKMNKKFTYENLNSNFKFDIKFLDITSISKYVDKKPLNKKFNYPWIRVELNDSSEILISNVIEVGKIKEGLKETDKILNKLIDKNIA